MAAGYLELSPPIPAYLGLSPPISAHLGLSRPIWAYRCLLQQLEQMLPRVEEGHVGEGVQVREAEPVAQRRLVRVGDGVRVGVRVGDGGLRWGWGWGWG